MSKEYDSMKICNEFCGESCWKARTITHQAENGGLSEENKADYLRAELNSLNPENCARPEIPARVVTEVVYKNDRIPEKVEEAIIDLDSRFGGERDIFVYDEGPNDREDTAAD